MAYSHPELVLVGAAQNLVLNQSTLAGKIVEVCHGFFDQDGAPHQYNDQAAW